MNEKHSTHKALVTLRRRRRRRGFGRRVRLLRRRSMRSLSRGGPCPESRTGPHRVAFWQYVYLYMYMYMYMYIYVYVYM